MSVIDGIVLPQKLWRPQQILMTTAKGETVQSIFSISFAVYACSEYQLTLCLNVFINIIDSPTF